MGKFVNIANQKFGNLLAIKRHSINADGCVIWECLCDCGKTIFTRSYNLRSGHTKSCGCLLKTSKCIGLTGQRFNRLTVIERVPNVKRNKTLWKCRCDCGNIVVVSRHSLISGHTGSCGCYNRDIRKIGVGEAAFNTLFKRYQQNAAKNNREFSLTREQFRQLVLSKCYYCGIPPSTVIHLKKTNGNFIYNGIDRFYNENGYTIENSVPCCWNCNSLKRGQSPEEFIKKIKTIYLYMFSNQRHDCPDWDYAVIDNTMTEFESCTCQGLKNVSAV